MCVRLVLRLRLALLELEVQLGQLVLARAKRRGARLSQVAGRSAFADGGALGLVAAASGASVLSCQSGKFEHRATMPLWMEPFLLNLYSAA